MFQEIHIDKDVVFLDSEEVYSGADNLNENEKLVRKALGLPIKKQLVYYSDKRDAGSVISVKEFRVIGMFDVTERWYTLECELWDNTKVHIHSSYFAEMQKPSFVADMASQIG